VKSTELYEILIVVLVALIVAFVVVLAVLIQAKKAGNNSGCRILGTPQNSQGSNSKKYSALPQRPTHISYMERMDLTKVTNTGKLNYHLKF
jgi:flagellar basal body-associated protein FliL